MLALIATLTPNRTYISSQLSRGSTCRRIRYRMISQPGGLWAISAANVLPVVLQTFVGILHDLEGILELGEPLPCRPGKSSIERYHRTRETDHLRLAVVETA